MSCRCIPSGVVALVASALMGAAASAAAQSTCADTDNQLDFENMDFTAKEMTDYLAANGKVKGDNYDYVDFTSRSEAADSPGWNKITSFGYTVANSATWKPNNPPGGVPFIFLFCKGHGVGRTFTGLVPGHEYVLSFYAAERQGYGGAQQLDVTVHGNILASFKPAAAWARHTYRFTPNELGEAHVELKNSGEGTSICANVALFLANFVLYPQRECGEGAVCHNPLPPARQYVCRCDGVHYIGKAVAGGPANCTESFDVAERVSEVQALVATVERGLGEAVVQAAALQNAVESLDQRLGAVEQANETVGRLATQLASLTTALRTGAALVPDASVELALEPKPDVSVAAVIEAEAGGLNFVLQDKRRATVNGAALLTVDDVTTLVRAAVVGALLSVADAVDE